MEISNEIINNIMSFNSHPVADLFKEALKYKLYNIMKRRTVHSFDDKSFANYYFHGYSEWSMSRSSWSIYNNHRIDYRGYRSFFDTSDED